MYNFILMSGSLCLSNSSGVLGETRRSFHVLLAFNLMMLLFNLVDRSGAVRLTNMSSPAVADIRDILTLDCKFDMGDEQLYAVKWYKDDQEFFRYMPGEIPPLKFFPVPGVHLLKPNCSQQYCKVLLDELTREHSGGAYRCEISTEAPTFRLASETHNVTVAALPQGELNIEGLIQEYSEGDVIMAYCTSDSSDPAPILSWYMNGHQAPHKFVGEMASAHPDSQWMVSRSLSLRFIVERKYFLGDKMELLCKSTLPGIPVSPQTATRIVSLRSQPTHVINNQKLHWLSGSTASWKRTGKLQIVLVTVVRWLVCVIQHIR